jgi:hypothetical protein
MDMVFDAPQDQETAPASGVANNVPRTPRRSTSSRRMPCCTGTVDKAVKAMSSELVGKLVWPKSMEDNVKHVWARLFAQVLLPIHAEMRHTSVNDASDMVNRVAIERTVKDDIVGRLPSQDVRARVLTLEERISELEVCVSEVRVHSAEASLSAAYTASPPEHVEEVVKRAQRTAAARCRSPSPLMRPVHEHGTGSAMLLPQYAVSEMLKAGVIEKQADGRLVRNSQMRQQPQQHLEAPDIQVQPQTQTQTQTAPQMMMSEGLQWQPQMQPQQTVPVQVWWQQCESGSTS